MPAIHKVNPALYLFVLAAALVAVFYPGSHPSPSPAARAMAVSSYHGAGSSLKAYHAAAPRSYQVRSGDTLSSIAASQLGSAARWDALWWVNRGHVPNPDEITAGEDLSLPVPSLQGPWLARRALDAVPRPPAPKPVIADAAAPAPPAPQPQPVASAPVPSAGGFEGCVIRAESGGDPTAYNSSSGASGLFGMLLSTWLSAGVGYPGGASTAPVSVQERAFAILYARDGTSPWAPYDGC